MCSVSLKSCDGKSDVTTFRTTARVYARLLVCVRGRGPMEPSQPCDNSNPQDRIRNFPSTCTPRTSIARSSNDESCTDHCTGATESHIDKSVQSCNQLSPEPQSEPQRDKSLSPSPQRPRAKAPPPRQSLHPPESFLRHAQQENTAQQNHNAQRDNNAQQDAPPSQERLLQVSNDDVAGSTPKKSNAPSNPFNAVPPKQCPVCGREYSSKSNMKQHYLTHFSPQYYCDIDGCKASFHKKNLLTRHELTYSCARPFVCPIESCSKDFTRKDNMETHVYAIHMPGVHKPAAQRERLTKHARGGKKPDFPVDEFPQLARFIKRANPPPTAPEVLQKVKAIFASRKDHTRTPTLKKMRSFAKKIDVVLSPSPNRRHIAYRPVEEATEDIDLQPYFDKLFILRAQQDQEKRPQG